MVRIKGWKKVKNKIDYKAWLHTTGTQIEITPIGGNKRLQGWLYNVYAYPFKTGKKEVYNINVKSMSDAEELAINLMKTHPRG